MNKLHLGFDLDGVIADWMLSFTKHANKTTGRGVYKTTDDIPTWNLKEWYLEPVLFHEAYDRWRAQQNQFTKLDDIDQQQTEYLSTMYNTKQDQFDFTFITSRWPTRGDPVKKQSEAWLQRRGISDPQVYVTGDKGRVCAALEVDYFIDDLVDNLYDVSSFSPRTVPIVMDRSYNQEYEGPRVSSILSFFDYVRNNENK